MNQSSEAARLVESGNELSDAGRVTDAENAYLAAAKRAPAWSVPLYNLGLLCKYQGRWEESLDFNQRATELDPDNEGSWWNLGIAATALENWTVARRAWQACGITLPAGEGAPDGDFGPVPVRLDPDGQGEVVWARRIDPARARLMNVPLPTSEFRWRDVVLHDGAPEGYRLLNGVQRPVFNVLSCFERSEFKTFVLEPGTADPDVLDRLEEIAEALGGAAEHWGSSTNILCRECSFGAPHEHSHESGSPAHPHCGVAARDETHAKQIIDEWLETTRGADIVGWTEAPATVRNDKP